MTPGPCTTSTSLRISSASGPEFAPRRRAVVACVPSWRADRHPLEGDDIVDNRGGAGGTTTARPMLGARCCGVNEACSARARPGKDPPGAILRSKPVVRAGAVPVYGFRAELPYEPSADRA